MASFKSDGKMIFMIFVGAIITVVFLAGIADSVFLQTNTVTATNSTITTAAVNGSTTLTGRANVTAITVVNASNAEDWSANFTVNTTDSDGTLGIFLVTTDDASEQASVSANVTYTYKPQGYIEESGSRSVSALIVIFGALAIVVFIVVIMFKNSPLLQKMGKAR